MNRLVCFALLVAGLVHLLPAVGALGASRLLSLYGVELIDAQLLVLMRHRALMFGVLGGLMVAAVFVPPLRAPMLVAALVSTLGFVLLARNEPLLAPLRRVFWIDVALAVLLTAAMLGWGSQVLVTGEARGR